MAIFTAPLSAAVTPVRAGPSTAGQPLGQPWAGRCWRTGWAGLADGDGGARLFSPVTWFRQISGTIRPGVTGLRHCEAGSGLMLLGLSPAFCIWLVVVAQDCSGWWRGSGKLPGPWGQRSWVCATGERGRG